MGRMDRLTPDSCIDPARLRNDLYCVEWGVKLYSNQPTIDPAVHTMLAVPVTAAFTRSLNCRQTGGLCRESQFRVQSSLLSVVTVLAWSALFLYVIANSLL